ncbi:MAG: hypothetical protein GY898_23620, partial [Proteobacteria bacterium]|nr:hypothetical protein [Pseudomonadota bacterium]
CSSAGSPAKEQCVPGMQLRLEAGGMVTEDAALSGNAAGMVVLDVNEMSGDVGVIRVSAVDDDAVEGPMHMSGLTLVVETADGCELSQAFPAGVVSSIAVRIKDNDVLDCSDEANADDCPTKPPAGNGTGAKASLVLSLGGVASGHDVAYGQAVPVIVTLSSPPTAPGLYVQVAAMGTNGETSAMLDASQLFTGSGEELLRAFDDAGVPEQSPFRASLTSAVTVLVPRDDWKQSVVVGFVAPAQATEGLRLVATARASEGEDALYEGVVASLDVGLMQSVANGGPTNALMFSSTGFVPTVEETSGGATTPVAEVLVTWWEIPSGCASGEPVTAVPDSIVSVFLADGHCRCDDVDRFDLPCSTGVSGPKHSLVFGSCGGCSSAGSPAKEQCVPGMQLRLEAGGMVTEDAALSGNAAGMVVLDVNE